MATWRSTDDSGRLVGDGSRLRVIGHDVLVDEHDRLRVQEAWNSGKRQRDWF